MAKPMKVKDQPCWFPGSILSPLHHAVSLRKANVLSLRPLKACGSKSALICVLTSSSLDSVIQPLLYNRTRSHANPPQDQGQENSATGCQLLGPAWPLAGFPHQGLRLITFRKPLLKHCQVGGKGISISLKWDFLILLTRNNATLNIFNSVNTHWIYNMCPIFS